MPYYIISYSWCDEYIPTIMEGPEVENWQEFCDSFLEEAVDIAIDKYTDDDLREEAGIYCRFVGWLEIEEALMTILEREGYKKVRFPTANYWGTSIIKEDNNDNDHNRDILSEHTIKKLAAHNEFSDEQRRSERNKK